MSSEHERYLRERATGHREQEPLVAKLLAVHRVEAAAARAGVGAACYRSSLLAAADEVRGIEVSEQPQAEATRRRNALIATVERCARLLRGGNDVRPVVTALGQVAQQLRRLVVVAIEPLGRRED
ncbi:hypothetical protein WME75_28235 [Sorangium sp. So ce1014]|uniref:hypothetical protein n=1 Tax=Sorangium sp. So ce1014 TaxID=3133326 RepID=UPI003F5ED0EE